MAVAANTAVKIVNRALQMCGVGASGRIAAINTGFTPGATTDDSKEGAAVALVYDTLRQAELRRNFWTFATERQVLREVDTATATTDKDITFPTYAGANTYEEKDIVTSGGILYQSLIDANIGNAVTDTASWTEYHGVEVAVYYDSTKTYYPGEIVYNGTQEYVFLKQVNGGNTPTADVDWHEFDGDGAITVANTTRQSPLGGNRTYAFDLPSDFLRLCPDDPAYEFQRKEWLIENDQILSDFAGPIFLRYIRDEQDPTKFDPLFSEALSARIALAVSEELTQSNTKLSTLAAIYNEAIGNARLVNAIEHGNIENEEEDWIAVRL